MSKLALVHCFATLALLVGCNTAPPVHPEEFAFVSPQWPRLDPTPNAATMAQPCYVGLGTKSCLDLDPRPFAICQLGTERCPHDAKLEQLDSATMARKHASPTILVIEPY